MRKVLVPVDGSGRSLKAVDQVRASFAPSAFEVVLLMVQENVEQPLSEDDANEIYGRLAQRLGKIQKRLDGYKIEKRASIGKAGEKILACAREIDADMIIMTKSTSSRNQENRSIGTTAAFVIRNSEWPVMLVPENVKAGPSVYRGMVIRKAAATVALKGQMNFNQTECLLPSVKGKCIYRIEVLKGSVRYVRRAYDPETLAWDLTPAVGEHQLIQINEGEIVDIPVKMDESQGKADRIRIINRSMREESTFRYRIMTVAQAEREAMEKKDEEAARTQAAEEQEAREAEAPEAPEDTDAVETKAAESEKDESADTPLIAAAPEAPRLSSGTETQEETPEDITEGSTEEGNEEAPAEIREEIPEEGIEEAQTEIRKNALAEASDETPDPESEDDSDIEEFQEVTDGDMDEMYKKLQEAFARYDAEAEKLESEKEELTRE